MLAMELKPVYDRAKSFYGKAQVETINGETILKSYNTYVCLVDRDGKFKRLWPGYSVTTQRHINEFIRQQGIDGGGAAWWRSLPVEKLNINN